METNAAPILKNITCRVCGRHLAWTIASAAILCPGCNTWTKPKKEKKAKRSKPIPKGDDYVQPSLWDAEAATHK